jgi:hypothetical protein
VRQRTDLLRPRAQRNGWEAPIFLVKRLRTLAARKSFWKESCDSWVPCEGAMRPAFRSLARHLFGLYEMPAFMDSAWDLPLGQEGFGQQAWYIRLGRGASLRSLNPVAGLTRRMEHHARQAPDHFTIGQAMRYGEAMGLGAGEMLARQIAVSFGAAKTADASFWRTVVMFLAAHREMPLKYVAPVIEFIQASKFGGEEVLTVNGVERRAPVWPNFSIAGRTVRSLLDLVEAWRLDIDEPKGGWSWRESGIEAFRFVESGANGEARDWAIVELLSSGALLAEGRGMQNCVFTYVDDCRRGVCAIWSLRLRIGAEEKRIATIEVDRARGAIVQLKAKRNRRAGRRSRELVSEWAERVGLACEWGD